MSWRWLERGAQPALLTLLEGIWLGTFAAVVLEARPWPLVLLAWALAGIGAALAGARVAGASGRGENGAAGGASGRGEDGSDGKGGRAGPGGSPNRRERLRRAAFAAVLVLTTAGLVMLQWPADARSAATLTLRDAVFVLLALWLGGRAADTTESRGVTFTAVRCFGLLVALLVASRAAHQPLDGAVTLVCAAMLAAVAVVALTRVTDELRGGPGDGRLPRGVLGLVLVIGLAVVLLAVASGPLQGPVNDLLGLIAAGLRRAADGVAFVVSWVAGAIMRLFSAIGDLFRGGAQNEPAMVSSPAATATSAPAAESGGSGLWAQVLIWLLVACCVVAGLVVLSRRRVWRRAEEPAHAEEHESLAGAGELPRRAFSRLAAMLARAERAVAPRTPAEALRREYRRLEVALAAAGHARAPDVSARAHLASLPLPADAGAHVSAGMDAGVGTHAGASVDAGARAGAGADIGALPGALASLYERARYSPFGCERQDVARFRELGARLRAAVGTE